MWKTLENDPLFARTYDPLTTEEKRRLTFLRMRKLFEYDFFNENDIMANPKKARAVNDILGSYDWSLAAKFMLNVVVSNNMIFTPSVCISSCSFLSIGCLGHITLSVIGDCIFVL